jgi:hypothetical protein
MIAFFVLFILYKIGEKLYETFEDVGKTNNTSDKLCRCGPFRALIAKCCCCCRKKQDTTSLSNDPEGLKVSKIITPFGSEDRFSVNIYEELAIDDLKREYQKT